MRRIHWCVYRCALMAFGLLRMWHRSLEPTINDTNSEPLLLAALLAAKVLELGARGMRRIVLALQTQDGLRNRELSG